MNNPELVNFTSQILLMLGLTVTQFQPITLTYTRLLEMWQKLNIHEWKVIIELFFFLLQNLKWKKWYWCRNLKFLIGMCSTFGTTLTFRGFSHSKSNFSLGSLVSKSVDLEEVLSGISWHYWVQTAHCVKHSIYYWAEQYIGSSLHYGWFCKLSKKNIWYTNNYIFYNAEFLIWLHIT